MSASVAKKLGVKTGTEMLILNGQGDVKTMLGDLPPAVTLVTKTARQYPMVLAFVKNKADVDSIGPAALKACQPEGALWFAYPKKTGTIKTDLSRDSGWDVLVAHGYRPVSQISIDATWTGFRFRPIQLVKSAYKKINRDF